MIYKNLFIICILFAKICIIYSQNITITAIMQSFFDFETAYYHLLTNGFNEYSREKGLGVELELKVMTPEASGKGVKNFGSTIDLLVSKKSTKYDIYFYYSTYAQTYGDNFVNLEDSGINFKVFDERILKEGCSSSDKKIIGLPLFIDISVLFSNMDLLSKYHKDPPKTWDELMSTSKYIYEEEKKNNNTIVRYHSSMNESNGSTAFYEFINSYRESNNSTHPYITSKETIEAMEKIKEMKNELGEAEFREGEDLVGAAIMFGTITNYLFIRYYYWGHVPLYRATALPGRKEGVSGTYVKSTNLSINKYIDEPRKKAAIEFLKYVSLKETQKKYIINNFMYSAMTELYDDEEVCNILECDVVKGAYPFSMKNNDVDLHGNDIYSKKYEKLLLQCLYEDKSIPETLKKIEDITKIYKFSLKTDDSNAGLIMFIIFIICFVFLVLSIAFIFIKKFETKFKFLTRDLWIVTILGSLILMSSVITLYEDVTNAKCHLRVTLINVGFVLSVCPFLHRLITNFPARNKISLWFENNKYLFIIVVMVITMSLNGIFAISSYHPEVLHTSDERNYQKCYMNSMFGNVMYYIIQACNILIILISLFLIYMEWNLKETSLDVNLLATTLFMDTLSIIFLNIIYGIKFKDDVLYSASLAANILFFSVSHHLTIYSIRILPIFSKNKEDSRSILKVSFNSETKKNHDLSTSVVNSVSIKNSEYNSSTDSTSTSSSKMKMFTQAITSYHNRRSIS